MTPPTLYTCLHLLRVPLIWMTGLTLMFFILLYYDRPATLVFMDLYLLHQFYCYMIHVVIFSWLGQHYIKG